MSTIASLLSMIGQEQPRPWDIATRSVNEAETGLRQLQELKRQQEAEALVRERIRQDPALAQQLFGGGMPQSTIGSLPTTGGPGGPPGAGPLTQQTTMPGQPPGAPQVVPGGQDLSRFATVPPTGGGPIPPNVMGQVMPTVTPPPGTGAMPTLGQPQEQRNPVLELARTNPDAAMMLFNQQTKMQTSRLDIGAKVAGGIARIIQGVTDQASLEQARHDVAMIDPRSAAQLPQFYSKEALEPFIKRAFTAQETAEVRLKTWQRQNEERANQLEEMKIGVQLTNAGYQGLGEGVTSILRGLTDEQVKQFGGRTTPAAVAYATEQGRKLASMSPAIKTELEIMKVNPIDAKPEQLAQAQTNIQDRELAKAGEAERLKFAQEQTQQKNLPLQDARKEDAGLWVYKGTGNTLPGTMPYGQAKTLQDEKDPEKGAIKLANLDEKKQLTTLKQLEPVLQQYAELVQYAYGANGPLENYTRSPGAVLGAAAGQAVQNDPVFAAKRRALQGQLQSVVRGLGARGDLNEQELAAAKEMIANMDASMGLGLNIGFGVGTGGAGPMVGVKPSFSVPDTPETGINLANELIGTVNRRIGSILQNEGYKKTPFITLRTNQQGQPPSGEIPQARPGSQTPPLSPPPPLGTPPATGALPPGAPIPPRTWGVAPAGPQPGQGTPAPAPAPATPAPAPAPSAPAPRPTPGRQSQASAGTRLAGAPKYMELADVAEAMRQTGKSRAEVERRARELGYTVYGSKLKLPEVTMVG